jgi:hypothetical protein
VQASRVVIAGAVSLVSASVMAVYGYTAGPGRSAAPGADLHAVAQPNGGARPDHPMSPADSPVRTQTGSATFGPSPSAKPKPSPPARPSAAVLRAQVLARARTWHPHTAQRIPYSQLRSHDGYRTDCSGYASMALGLAAPGPITVGLASSGVSTPIAISALQPGDLIIDATGNNNTRHVVIFDKWANGGHTAYWEYEQRGGYGTDYRTRTYGLVAGSEYHAYRPKKYG